MYISHIYSHTTINTGNYSNCCKYEPEKVQNDSKYPLASTTTNFKKNIGPTVESFSIPAGHNLLYYTLIHT